MNNESVYLVMFDASTWVVEAESFGQAVSKWKAMICRDPEFDGDEEPDEVHRRHDWHVLR